MGYIYKISNTINNKLYIGMTRYNIEHRWKEHKSSYQYKNTHLYSAMRKYGVDNFNIEIIEECPEEDLIIREAYWISYYDSYKNGYNMTEGKGEGNGTSFNARPIRQYDLEGNFITEFKSCGEASAKTGIQNANIQRTARGGCYSAGNYQWRFSDDNRPVNRIKPHTSGGKGRVVLQYDKDWNLINTFSSNRQAASFLGLKGTILKHHFNDGQLYRGYYWKYADEFDTSAH